MSRMEGLFTAWGRILSGRAPNLSIEITRECPLRCPGCYAYGDEHLGGDVTLREVARLQGRRAGRRRHAAAGRRAQAAASLDRRRRAAGPLPRAEHAAADPGRARHAHAARDERRAPDPDRVGAPAAPADRRLDRRPAARARRAAQAGDLRPHPEAHRRPPDHRPLHGHAPAGAAVPATSRSSCSSGRPTPTPARSGSASTRRRSARSAPEILRRPIASGSSRICCALRDAVPEARRCPRA